MRDLKVGDWVIFTDKETSNYWEKWEGIFLYGKVAKIIYIDPFRQYLLEFKEYINGIYGDGRGKEGHCMWCRKENLKLYINHLKFKKWIKGE